ncbi:glycosyltransferase [Caldichromatium japonicum]|uniref:Glycosyltransferase n=1 Tax=Caldichromatium japonicum TaxID=2699430 RepID=A0A6G7VGD4_9GAMM|nr:glycosyltransferase [Caldichromatium japonicum]QIK38908.1 glycosyltransferase [Caldichromatium japonicum]
MPQYRESLAQPLISVLIRTLWRSTLQEALDSVATQTYPRVEVVLIDALGTGAPQSIERCGPFPARVIGHGRRLRRGEAANLGLDAAQGDLLLFLDDDDWLLPEHLAGLVESLQGREDALAAYAGIECRRQRAQGDWEVVHVFNQPYDPVRLLIENYLPIHAVLFDHRLIAQGIRFDESLAVYEDWDFWVQVSALTSLVRVDRVTGVYRIQGGGGFGVQGGEDRRIDPGLAAFFAKWRARWTPEQVLRIAEYAKHRPMYEALRAHCESERQRYEKQLAEFHHLRTAHGELQVRAALWDAEKRTLQSEIQGLRARLEYIESSLQRERELLDLLGVWSLRAALQCRKDLERGRSLAGCLVWLDELTAGLDAWLQKRLAPLGAPLDRLRAHAVHLTEIARFHGPWPIAQVLIARLRRDPQRPSLRTLWQAARIARFCSGAPHPHPLSQKESGGRNPSLSSGMEGAGEGTTAPPIASAPTAALPAPGDLDNQAGRTHALATPQFALIVDSAHACVHTFWTLEDLLYSRHVPPFEVLVVYPEGDPLGPLLGRCAPGIKHLGISGSDVAGRYRAIIEATPAAWLMELDCLEAKPQDWLWRLLHAPRLLADAAVPVGALRPRLIGADGRLLEFGQVRGPNGALQPFGAGDDPEAPAYGAPRLVDGASAPGLVLNRRAVERVLAEKGPSISTLAGFLEQLRAQGFGLYAWPEVSLVHPSRCAVTTAIHHHRVLVIDAVMLMPDQDSGSLRMWRLLEILIGLGWRVTFIPSNLEPVEPYRTQLMLRGVEVLATPEITSVQHHLERRGAEYDLVILSRVLVAGQYLDLVREYAPQARVWFDTVDLHFLREQRAAELTNDPAAYKRAAWRKRQELALIEGADLTLVVSPAEQALLAQELPQARIERLSNIHDPDPTPAPFAARDAILFIGGFNHDPNVDAVRYYVAKVLPEVLRSLGPVPTLIVGSRPPPVIQSLHAPERGLHVLGYVEDVRPLFDRARLSIAPLRYGAGVKGKINQSMAYGVPVVATPLAAEGMALSHERDVLIAPDAAAFAECVVRLYRDQELWERLRQGGIANIERYFSSAQARATLERLLAEVAP